MSKLFIDIGGTHLRSVLETRMGPSSEKHATQRVGLFGYIERQMAEHSDISFIGISYAGQVDNGYILSAPNIDVDEHAIKTAVEQRYGIRLEIDNDLNCAARAEAAYWNSTYLASLYVGTGIGAAVIENAHLIRGSRNLSYEIGHIPYRNAPFTCGCGRSNCLELYASGSGMAKWLEHHGKEGKVDLNRFRHSEKPFEQMIAQEFEEALMQGVGTLVTLSNPQILVLGGGIIRKNPYLVRMVKEKIEQFALQGSVDGLRIVASRLENGSLEGAKLLEKMDG